MIIREVFAIEQENRNRSFNEKVEIVLNILRRQRAVENIWLNAIRNLFIQFRLKWQKSGRSMNRFLRENDDWLQKEVTFSAGGAQRARQTFDRLSTRSKLRRTATIRQNFSREELTFAASSKLYMEGKRKLSKQLKNENTAEKNNNNLQLRPYTPEEALNLIVETKLSKDQYNLLRSSGRNANLYPAYWLIKQAKKLCYPSQIIVTEEYAEISLSSWLEHTANRLSLAINPVIDSLGELQNNHFDITLVSKWGSDGSSGYSMFKQVSLDPNLDDSSLYATSVVPIQMFFVKEKNKKVIIWQNPRTSSPCYCRPLKLHFVKETKDQILEQTNNVQQQIQNLQPTNITYMGQNFSIVHDLHLTMVDLKFCNAVTDTKSAQVCYVCGCKPSQMNDVDCAKKVKCKSRCSEIWFSTLHCYIRTFEYLLHIAYKLQHKKYQTKDQKEKDAINCRKQHIQKEFRARLGLIVDVPKQGFGSSNDGNTARRFFLNAQISSEITGIDLSVIKRLSTILGIVSSGYEIDLEKFKDFSLKTAELVISLYPWYIMPPTVHKLLIHGSEIISAAPLPIGMLSEDAQESQHKECKYIRTFHTRKCGRKESNEDLLHMCLIRSDPFITSLRRLPRKSGPHLETEAFGMLKEPNRTYLGNVEPIEFGDLPEESV